MSFPRRREQGFDMKPFKEYRFWVYILFDARAKGTYIGFTNNLEYRILEHKRGLVKGFAREKGLDKLAYYEEHRYWNKAIAREKALKKWNRAWKYRLIETINPEWKDLAEGINWMIDPDKCIAEFLERLNKNPNMQV